MPDHTEPRHRKSGAPAFGPTGNQGRHVDLGRRSDFPKPGWISEARVMARVTGSMGATVAHQSGDFLGLETYDRESGTTTFDIPATGETFAYTS